jgi:hypothetical protein
MDGRKKRKSTILPSLGLSRATMLFFVVDHHFISPKMRVSLIAVQLSFTSTQRGMPKRHFRRKKIVITTTIFHLPKQTVATINHWIRHDVLFSHIRGRSRFGILGKAPCAKHVCQEEVKQVSEGML